MTHIMMYNIYFPSKYSHTLKKKHAAIVCLFSLEAFKHLSGPPGFAVTPQHGSGRGHSTQEQAQQTNVPKTSMLPSLRHCSRKKQKTRSTILVYDVL